MRFLEALVPGGQVFLEAPEHVVLGLVAGDHRVDGGLATAEGVVLVVLVGDRAALKVRARRRQHLIVVEHVPVDVRLEVGPLACRILGLRREHEHELVVAHAEIVAVDAEAELLVDLDGFGLLRESSGPLQEPQRVRVVAELLLIAQLAQVGEDLHQLFVAIHGLAPGGELRVVRLGEVDGLGFCAAELLADVLEHAAEGLIGGDLATGHHLHRHPLVPDLLGLALVFSREGLHRGLHVRRELGEERVGGGVGEELQQP